MLVSKWTMGDTTAYMFSDGKRMELGMAGHAFNPSSWEAEKRESCMETRLGSLTRSLRKP